MFEQRTLKSLAEQIHQMRGSIGQVPKPKDKPTAIKILQKLIDEENAKAAEAKKAEDTRVAALSEGTIGEVGKAGKVVRVKSAGKTVRKMNEQPHCRFNEKQFTLLMDNSAQHVEIYNSFPTQARLLLLAWKKKEATVTGDRLVEICEKDGPRGDRSAKLIIQRYMTYFVRQGLVAYAKAGEKANHA